MHCCCYFARGFYRGSTTAFITAVAFLLLTGAFPALAIVDAKSAANTNAPADGSPWANVGHVKGIATGIYIGNGCVLTPAHIGPGSIELAGSTYLWDGNFLRVTNTDGTDADMYVFRLTTIPPLSKLVLATNAPAASAQVDMIGEGYIAGSGQISISGHQGFLWSSNVFKAWGNNKVTSGGLMNLTNGAGKLVVFTTTFDSSGQTTDEAQATAGDSGGAVFQLVNSTWQLVGMIDAIGTQVSSNAAVFGDITYVANISTYRNQIISLAGLTNPPPVYISKSGANVQVCWPDTAVGFNLEGATNIAAPVWTTVRSGLLATNGQGCAVLPETNAIKYFRLKKP